MAAENEIVEQKVEMILVPPHESSARSAASNIKTILFHVHNDDAVSDRLQLALTIARTCGAHIHCLHVTSIEAFAALDGFATFVNQEVVRALEEQSESLRKQIEEQLKIEDVSWDYEQIVGALVPRLVQRAALADLVITGRERVGGPALWLAPELLLRIRSTLFITGDRLIEWDPFGSTVIAWNGSYEAANAVRSSLSLLRLARRVYVAQFKEAEQDEQFPSSEVLKYLARHGIEAEIDCRAPPGSVDGALLDYAQSIDAGMIVMGAFSHSRGGEFLFGGVTRSLLQRSPIALVMAH